MEVRVLPPAPYIMPKPVDHVVLIHGYAENPAKAWFPWIHQLIEERGVRVSAPVLPDPLRPDYKNWLKVMEKPAAKWTGSTVVVAHSIGGVLALRALENLAQTPIRAMITVATPFTATVSIRAYIDFFQAPIDWDKLRRSAGRFITIQSKNDPLVPFDHVSRYKEVLDSKLVLTEKDGHFRDKTAPAVWQELEKLLPKQS